MRQIFSPLDGFRSPFGALRGGFSPSALFALAEPGVWYDPSDLTTLFTDTAGTTPVTTPGQTVALVLDKSKGLVLGSETVVSPLAGALGTSYSVVGNTIVRNGSTGTAILNAVGGVASATNKTYLVTFTASGVTGDATGIRVGGGTAYGPFSGDGTFTLRVVGGGVSGSITFIPWVGGAATATYSNISVRELPGFHATQATAASRPTYGIVPRTGRRNLLTFTEQFDNAAWAKTNATVTANAGTAPDGTTTADKVVPNTVNTQHHVSVSFTSVASQYTMTVYAKADGYQWLWFNATGAGSPVNDLCWFDVLNGVVGTAQTGATTSIEGVGGGWYRCICRWSAFTANSAGVWIAVASADNQSAGFTGDGTSGILIWGAQLETGSSATAYQRVGSAFDVTEAGVPSLSYLSFDGVDDFLVTPTITPGIDKAQVFAGVRKLSDAASSLLVETSTTSTSTANTIGLLNSTTTGGQNRFNSAGSVRIDAFATIAAPATFIYTGLSDVAAPSVDLRINSVSGGAATGSQGTVGNYAAHPIYIGRRGGTTAPFNGNLYGLIVRFGTNLDAGTITSTETWVNGKTGAY